MVCGVCCGEEEAEPEGEEFAAAAGGFRLVEECCSHSPTLFIISPDIGLRFPAGDISITSLFCITKRRETDRSWGRPEEK